MERLDSGKGLHRLAKGCRTLGCGQLVASADLQPGPDEEQFHDALFQSRLLRGAEVLEALLLLPRIALHCFVKVQRRAAVRLGLVQDRAVHGVHFGMDAMAKSLELVEPLEWIGLGGKQVGDPLGFLGERPVAVAARFQVCPRFDNLATGRRIIGRFQQCGGRRQMPADILPQCGCPAVSVPAIVPAVRPNNRTIVATDQTSGRCRRAHLAAWSASVGGRAWIGSLAR